MTPARPVALLFTDLVGSTELAQGLGPESAEAFRRLHFGLIRDAVAAHRGREVKNLGDGLMVAFDSTSDAVTAAVAIQCAVAEHNRTGASPSFSLRVGVHHGHAVEDGGDYFGEPVTIAKRLCDRANPGRILAGQGVADHLPADLEIRPVGPLELKGLADPVLTVEVVWDPVSPPGGPAASGPPAGRLVRPPSLTPPPDTFLGRDGDVARLVKLLAEARLVTVVGPGGVGKTRLVGHAVETVAADYPDGVWCVALAAVDTDAQVADAVATTVGVQRRAGMTPADRVIEFLSTKRAVLLLDNCEHLLDGAAALIERVLGGTPGINVLTTSREALGIRGEKRMLLDPLTASADLMGAAPAVALFLDRAAATGAVGADADLPTVEQLCRQLDGLPLAIELAAARTATRTVAEILEDVTERLTDLAVRRGRDARHRSIHALIDWSYDRLDEPDRRLFDRFAVFAGGADADAVAAVTGSSRAQAIEQLGSLVDQSLLGARHTESGTRYSMLVPVREYALRRLQNSATERSTKDAHARHFVAVLERVAEGTRGTDALDSIRLLEREVPNLRLAHGWLIESNDAETWMALAGSLFWCYFHGGLTEAIGWAEEGVAAFTDSNLPGLPAAFAAAAGGAWMRGDMAQVAELAERSLQAAGTDPAARRFGLLASGIAAVHRGEFEEAAESMAQAAAAARTVGDDFMVAWALGCQAAYLSYTDDPARAAAHAEACLEVAERLRSPTALAYANFFSGEAYQNVDPERAVQLLERALAEASRTGCRWVSGAAGLSLVSLQARRGDPAAILPRFAEVVEHLLRTGVWVQQGLALRALVQALARIGHARPAAVLLGALGTGRLATRLAGADAVRIAAVVAELEAVLGPDQLTACQEEGAALGDLGGVQYAQQVLHELTGRT